MSKRKISIDLSRMCDRCYKELSLSEEFYGFNIKDNFGTERLFKGHKNCVQLMAVEIRDIYGEDEDDAERI